MKYGFVYNLSGSPLYACIWEGARDSTSNNSVSYLVNGLIDAGYPPASYKGKLEPLSVFRTNIDKAFDAVFDSSVKQALIAWQTAKGIRPDGIAGPDTWHALLGGSTPTKNCPACAGNFPYGTTAPENCKSNLPSEEGGSSVWWWIGGTLAVAGLAALGVYAYKKSKSRG